MKILKQNNVKGTLTSVEKKRFRQIGDQFFKGSYEFFVHYQETIHKTVDINIINNNFVQYFQNQLKEAKEKLIDKAQILEQEKAKEKFYNRLLNFIITLQVGVIAFLKLPMDFKKIRDFASQTIDNITQGVVLLKNAAGVWIDLGSWLGEVYGSVMSNIGKMVGHSFSFMLNCVGYFLYHSGTFSICFEELAIKIGKRSSGLVGVILKTLMWFIKEESYKKPNIRHWLLYGQDEYEEVKALENELHEMITNSKDDAFFTSFFTSSANIGVLVDGEWVGVDAGKSWSEKEMELEDVKGVLNDLYISTQNAIAQRSEEYTVKSMVGSPNFLDSNFYKYEMPKKIKEILGKEVDVGLFNGSDVNFFDLMVTLNQNDTENANGINLEKFKQKATVVSDFYKQYKNSKDPFAKYICEEIRDKLDKNGIVFSDEDNRVKIKTLIYLPGIYYAIMQFNFTERRNEKIVASMDRTLYALNEKMEFLTKNNELQAYKEVEKKFLDGTIDFTQFVKWVIESLGKDEFKMSKINPKTTLGFVFMANKSRKILNDGFNLIALVKSGSKKYRTQQYIKITKDNINTLDEIQIGNSEALVINISENHKVVKENLAVAYKKRTEMLNRIKDKISEMKNKGIFILNIDGYLMKIDQKTYRTKNEELKGDRKKLQQDREKFIKSKRFNKEDIDKIDKKINDINRELYKDVNPQNAQHKGMLIGH